MSVWKKWVVPVVRGVVVLVVVVSLVRIAFFSSSGGDEGVVASGGVVDPVVVPVVGTVRSDVTVRGVVAEGEVGVGKASLSGVVDEVFVQKGAEVTAGQVLASIRYEKPVGSGQPGASGGSGEGSGGVEVEWGEVLAPVTGRVERVGVVARQQVQAGEGVVDVVPSQLVVSGAVSPKQRYRLGEGPGEVVVTVPGGPDAFGCEGVEFVSGGSSGAGGGQQPVASGGAGAAGGSGAAGGAGGSGAGGGVRVLCRVPDGVRVFAGSEAVLVLRGGVAEGVLTLPVTAVRGGAGSGTVMVVGADGSRQERAVVLGVSDGKVVEVVEGVGEGEQVLEFFPGTPAPGQSCVVDAGTGQEVCAQESGSPGPGSSEPGSSEPGATREVARGVGRARRSGGRCSVGRWSGGWLSAGRSPAVRVFAGWVSVVWVGGVW